MAGSRAEILGKIRQALVKPRPKHHHGHSSAVSDLKQLFASVASRDGLVERFQTEFELVSGEYCFFTNGAAVVESLIEVIETSASNQVAISEHPLCNRLAIIEALRAQLPGVTFLTEDVAADNAFDRTRLRNSMAKVQLSITGAEYLIADTGTIVTVAGPQASRQISLLPSIHVVLATPSQIFPNMAELFVEIQTAHGPKLPGSAITFITGPSRTADIELTMTRGVHGPRELHLILVRP